MGSPFRSIVQCATVLQGSVVEIGSERGEGSTAFLSNVCKQLGLKFYSVDFEQEAYLKAKGTPNTIAVQSTGEEFLKNFPKNEKICYAYLDNYDWDYVDNYDWDVMGPEHTKKQKKRYELYGLTLSNKNSQKAHLDQTILISQLAADKCIISFDDTFYDDELKCVSGKGGTAHDWLTGEGWGNYKNTDYFNFYDRDFLKNYIRYQVGLSI